MRDLIVSFLIVAVLVGSWVTFYNYSEHHLDEYKNKVEKEIIPAVEDENWEESNKLMKVLNKDWHKYKKIALFFLDTDTVNEIDYSLAKSIKYVKAKDVSNSSGELNSMIEQLTFLSENDFLNLENIF